MNEQPALQTPQAVVMKLNISPATLRRWADEFAAYLSPQTNSAQGKSHRRYTGKDIETLQAVKEYMNSGMTYEQVRRRLTQQFAAPLDPFPIPNEYPDDNTGENKVERAPELPDEEALETHESKSLMTSNGNEPPALTFLTNALTTLSDTQQSILNSQAANRELIGVLIQDNFNLKDENNRLRERILEVERNMAQVRQEDEWRRETLRQEMDVKLGAVQQMATDALTTAHAVEMPDIKTIKGKPGCLGALLGGGDTQVVSVPRRRARDSREARPAGAAPASAQQYASAPPPAAPVQQPPPAHPKPTAPPE